MKCKIHEIKLECMSGESAHPSNWYCPICSRDKEIESLHQQLRAMKFQDQEVASLLAENAKIQGQLAEREKEIERLQDQRFVEPGSDEAAYQKYLSKQEGDKI